MQQLLVLMILLGLLPAAAPNTESFLSILFSLAVLSVSALTDSPPDKGSVRTVNKEEVSFNSRCRSLCNYRSALLLLLLLLQQCIKGFISVTPWVVPLASLQATQGPLAPSLPEDFLLSLLGITGPGQDVSPYRSNDNVNSGRESES